MRVTQRYQWRRARQGRLVEMAAPGRGGTGLKQPLGKEQQTYPLCWWGFGLRG